MDHFFIIGTDERIVIIRYISIIKFVFQQKFLLFVRGRTFKFLCVWLEGRLRRVTGNREVCTDTAGGRIS